MGDSKGKDVIINIPVRLKYYLDPLAILLGAILVCGVLIYVGSLLK